MIIKENGIEFWIETNEATIVNAKIINQSTRIPEHIHNIPITKISPSAFVGSDFQEILLPSTIKQIGAEAFANCHQLETVIIYKAGRQCKHKFLKLEKKAFIGCLSLTYFHMDNKLLIIGEQAFASCSKLMEINGYVYEIKNGGLDGCHALTYLVFSNNAILNDNSIANFNSMSGLTFVGEAKASEKTLQDIKKEGMRIVCRKNTNLENLAYEGFDVSIIEG